MTFPIQRPRRLRLNAALRAMVREHHIRPDQLIYPLFIKEGIDQKKPISAMPGVFQFSLKEVAEEANEAYQKGIRSLLLFGIPSKKDKKASQAYNPDGIVQKAIKIIKNKAPDLVIMTDVCLCEYMEHGHCGIIGKNQEIENDSTLELLAQTALSHAQAGADLVSPSDMMDGRVAAIRKKLDSEGFHHTPIMSYAAKYASHFYGPFREAAESAPQFGDRKSYQMDSANVKEALKEIQLDEKEGADILLIKPALPYLDIIAKASAQTNLPIAAYQVSGEYSMIMAAVEKGWLDKKEAVLESLMAIRRAGAQLIVTYFAKEALDYLR